MKVRSDLRRSLLPLLAAAAICLPSCDEARTPTEPTDIGAKATLSGVVTDESGVPLTGLLVVCQGKRVNSTTAGGPPGSYGFSDLAPGTATVAVYQGGVQKPTSFDVELKPGANTRNLSVVRFHGQPASVSGVVTVATSRPIAGVRVSCQGKQAVVAADGSYSMSDLESGYWEIGAVWDGYEGEYGEATTLTPGRNIVDLSIPY